MAKVNINDLYDEMFETIKMIKEDEIEIDKANAIANLGKVITDAAKVEAAFLRSTKQIKSDFLLDDEKRAKMELEAKRLLSENQKFFKEK